MLLEGALTFVMALQSNSSYKIISQDVAQNDKVLFHIKLTDSCLKSLERHKQQTTRKASYQNNLNPDCFTNEWLYIL